MDSTLVPIDFARFGYLIRYAPSFALVVMRTMAERLRAMDGRAAGSFVQSLAEIDDPAHMSAHLDHLRNDPSVLSIAAGTTIFERGDPGGSMFVVLDGEVAIVTGDGDPIATAKAGEVFGEMSLCDHQPRSATVVATTGVRILPIDALRFTYLVQNNPNFAISVMRSMADSLRNANFALVE
jgi:CRP-like cAMP-binding protein